MVNIDWQLYLLPAFRGQVETNVDINRRRDSALCSVYCVLLEKYRCREVLVLAVNLKS